MLKNVKVSLALKEIVHNYEKTARGGKKNISGAVGGETYFSLPTGVISSVKLNLPTYGLKRCFTRKIFVMNPAMGSLI